ncbi:MAG: hypothetical protein ACON3Z_04590 [Bradymonadia bacterium]
MGQLDRPSQLHCRRSRRADLKRLAILSILFACSSGCAIDVPQNAAFPQDDDAAVLGQTDGQVASDARPDEPNRSFDAATTDSTAERRSPQEAGWIRYHTQIESCAPRYNGPRVTEFNVTDWPPCEGDLRGQAWCQNRRDDSQSRCQLCEQGLFYCPGAQQDLGGLDTDAALVDAAVIDAAPPALCGENERVLNEQCIPCAPGETNAANDRIADGNTTCDAVACDRDEYVLDHVCTPCGAGEVNEPGDRANGPDTQCDAIDPCTAARAILEGDEGRVTVRGFRVDVFDENRSVYNTCDDDLRLSQDEWRQLSDGDDDRNSSLRWSFTIEVVGGDVVAVFSSNSSVDLLDDNGNRTQVGTGTVSMVLREGNHSFAMAYEASRIEFPQEPPTMTVELRWRD